MHPLGILIRKTHITITQWQLCVAVTEHLQKISLEEERLIEAQRHRGISHGELTQLR